MPTLDPKILDPRRRDNTYIPSPVELTGETAKNHLFHTHPLTRQEVKKMGWGRLHEVIEKDFNYFLWYNRDNPIGAVTRLVKNLCTKTPGIILVVVPFAAAGAPIFLPAVAVGLVLVGQKLLTRKRSEPDGDNPNFEDRRLNNVKLPPEPVTEMTPQERQYFDELSEYEFSQATLDEDAASKLLDAAFAYDSSATNRLKNLISNLYQETPDLHRETRGATGVLNKILENRVHRMLLIDTLADAPRSEIEGEINHIARRCRDRVFSSHAFEVHGALRAIWAQNAPNRGTPPSTPSFDL